MKIGIEGQRLFRPNKHGMDFVALELIRQLQQHDKENEYVIFVRPGADNTCLTATDNFTIQEVPGRSYPTWEQIQLPAAARKAGVDILHCTSNTAPLRTEIPLIITLHDVIYLEKKTAKRSGRNWYQQLGNVYRKWVVPSVADASRVLITVSNYEKEQILKAMPIPAQKVEVVYNGVSEHFKPVTDAAILQQVCEKYMLPERFIFFLGNTDPKKNLRGVIQAYDTYLRRTGDTIPLVMVDYPEPALQRVLAELGCSKLREKIHLTGYLPNMDLPAIYSQCELFLYPSLRESFGIPILEAMACGVPTITSSVTSMPEIAGDAALLVDPQDSAELTRAMQNVLGDEALRDQLRRKGPERAALFSWSQTALGVMEIYRRIEKELNN